MNYPALQQIKMSLQLHHTQSNKWTTRGSSGFHVNTSGSNKGRIKNAKIPYNYGTAKGGNIISGLPGIKTRHISIYGARKETSDDAIKTLLIGNGITVFSAAVVSNELATYKSFKVTIPADRKGATCLASIWPKEIRVRDFIDPVKQTRTNNGDSNGSIQLQRF